MSKKSTLIVALWCVFALGLTQEETRDTKQHPELPKLVRMWAQKLGGELWHFGELVTRRTMVIESFKRTTVVKEDGEALLKEIHEKVSTMMEEKVKAVQRIMETAEQVAKEQKEEDIDFNFQFVNAKNLTNSAPNATMSDQEVHEEAPQELRFDDSFVSTDSRYEERYQAMVQPEEDMEGYQQDQEQPEEDSKGFDEADGEIE
ncbi:hypothetical protein BDFB_011957, partial [Asbolus verrucosus]